MDRRVTRYVGMWVAAFALAGIAAAVATRGRALVFAGALLALCALMHSVAGERFIIARILRRSDLPKLVGSEALMRRSLRVAWHLTSIAWWCLAALLIAASDGDLSRHGALRIMAVGFAASGTLALIVTRGAHLSWTVFLAVAISCWVAS